MAFANLLIQLMSWCILIFFFTFTGMFLWRCNTRGTLRLWTPFACLAFATVPDFYFWSHGQANWGVIFRWQWANSNRYLHLGLANPGGNESLFFFIYIILQVLNTLVTWAVGAVRSVTAFTAFCGPLPSRSLTWLSGNKNVAQAFFV